MRPGDPTLQEDFYLGRGPNARYLGTAILTEHQVNLDLFRSLGEDEYTQDDYLYHVSALTGIPTPTAMATVGGAQTPLWPHGHADSTETPWTYCYDKGTVYVYRYGVEMLQVRCNTHRWTGRDPATRKREWRPVNEFPTLTVAER
jgi:hypothetical protein